MTRAVTRRAVRTSVVAAAIVVSSAACLRPTAVARTTHEEPESEAEREAAARLAERSCSPRWGLLFPGVGDLCTGQSREGAAMLALGAAELGTSIAAASRVEAEPGESVLAHPAVAIPLIGLQQTYLYAAADLAILEDRAARRRFAPLDTTADLAAAPFNIEVMKRPEIWLALTASVAAVVGVSFLIEDDLTLSTFATDANLFGKRLPFAAGYRLALGAFGGLDLQVAMGEEALFRGVVQSVLARRFGETEGLLGGSLIFGLLHVPAGLGLEGQDRRNFFLYKLPATLATGTYFSWLYKRSGYLDGTSLRHAVHRDALHGVMGRNSIALFLPGSPMKPEAFQQVTGLRWSNPMGYLPIVRSAQRARSRRPHYGGRAQRSTCPSCGLSSRPIFTDELNALG